MLFAPQTRASVATRTLVTRSLMALLVILAANACTERFEEEYRTLAEAEADGAVKRGWIPHDVPPTSRNIREWHDLDTNRGFGLLEFTDRDEEWIQQHLRPLPSGIEFVDTRGGGPDWWPPELAGALDRGALEQRNVTLYQSSEFGFAVDTSTNRLYFWQRRP